MKNVLNTLHYCMYLLDRKLHFMSNKINPFFIKKQQNSGVNYKDVYNKIFSDKEYGLNAMVADAALSITLFLILLSFIKITLSILEINVSLKEVHFIILGLISFLICYFLVFKNNKYIEYYNKYESWTIFEKRKNIFLTIGIILLSISMFFITDYTSKAYSLVLLLN